MRTTRVSTRIAATVLLAALPGLAGVALAGPAAAQPRARTTAGPPALVTLRIEGANRTIFEGTVATHGHDVTTSAGGTHHCDGTNNSANAASGPTATAALDTAAKQDGFDYDGSFDASFDDFFITRIGPDNQTATQFWGLLRNYQFTPVGGCQQQVDTGDEVLWAFDAFNKAHVLKLTGPRTAHRNEPVTLHVSDGASGAPVAGATVAGATSDANGDVAVTLDAGLQRVKAEKSDSIRSNALPLIVTG